MAVPLITDTTIVHADDWWNPLATLANDNEADIAAEITNRTAAVTAINTRLNSTIAGTGISDLPTWKTATDNAISAETTARASADTTINNRLNSTIANNGISDLPAWKVTVDAFLAAPNYKRKTAIQTLNNNVTLTSDTHLVWAMATNSVYLLDCTLFYDSSTIADLKIQFTVPAAASILWGCQGLDTALAYKNLAGLAASSPQTFGGAAVGSHRMIQIAGQVTTVGTAGNLTLQWAQNTLDPTNTNMQPGSFGLLQKVA